MTTIEERLAEAHRTYRNAADEVHKAEAERVRQVLLELGAERFSFEVEYEYDDQGGYIRGVEVTLTKPDGTLFEYEDDDVDGDTLHDLQMVPPEALSLLCSSPDEREGEVVVTTLKDKRF